LDKREFAKLVTKEAIDGVVQSTLDRLRNPIVFRDQPASGWFAKQQLESQRQSEWFRNLSPDDRSRIESIIKGTAELSTFSFLTLIDGVAGSYEGVFEIVAVDADENRTVINPENTEMLHDVFSEICEEER